MGGFSALILVFLSNIHLCYQQDVVLNAPQVLLPFNVKNSPPVTYILRANKGCFKWISSKPTVVSVTPFDEKSNVTLQEDQCSLAALIAVTQKSPDEDSSVVLAEEESTGVTLRCDVFVDSISHIEIATTTRKILLGESPEVFEVFAYDAEGNLFTFLGGQSFEWSWQPIKVQDQRTLLRFLWFQDSVYETKQEIYDLETQQQRGSEVLIEGLNTGEAAIIAKLTSPEYKNVKPSKVDVVIVDNIMLLPPLSYILPRQIVFYKACQLRSKQKRDITLPSDQYTIDVVNKTVVDLKTQDASVVGKTLGQTKVLLVDNNMLEASAAKKPSANVYVVEPGKIGFAINPGKYWVLQTGRQYHLHVQLFDDENNKILITDHTYFDSLLSEEHFDVHFVSKNQTYFFVTAKKVGKTLLTSRLDSIQYLDEDPFKFGSIHGEQNIEIYDPLVLEPKSLVLPWDPQEESDEYQFQFNVKGGSGNYQWSVSNTTVAIVNKKGLISTQNRIGKTQVKVADSKNPTFFDVGTVTVLPPEELNFVSQHLEVELGKVIDLPLSVLAYLNEDKKKAVEFADCRKMTLEIKIEGSTQETVMRHIANVNKDALPAKGCTTVSLKGLSVGYAKITASHRYDNVIIQDTLHVAVYQPVKIVDPVKFSTVALGSTKRIVAEGGPLPWVLDPKHHYDVMSAEEEDWVRIKSRGRETNQGEALHYFDVTCTVLGEQLLTVEVGNRPSSSLPFPAVSSAKTKFSCVPPATMVLTPNVLYPMIDGTRRTIESCKDQQKRIPVRNDRELTIYLAIYDSNGNKFDDASSLNIQWSSDRNDVASFPSQDTLYEGYQGNAIHNGGTKIFQKLKVHSMSDTLRITAKISGVMESQANEVAVNPPITANLRLLPLASPLVEPSTLNLYAHPSNKANLKVEHGTGNFVLNTNDDSLSKVLYNPPNGISITPQRKGSLVLRLIDACLDLTDPYEVRVGLHDADGVFLTVKDKVEVGKSIQAKCSVIDANQKELKIDANAEMNLSLKMVTNILDIQSSTKDNMTIHKGERTYDLIGRTVGTTNLYCQATKISGKELTSAHKEVQVFSAIHLEPKYIILIVDSVFQIHSSGGPRPHSTTVYTVDNKTVADVSQTGLITARKIGKTVVVGKARGYDSQSGNEIVYSSDVTIVEVIMITGFKIALKSRNIINNAKIGVMAVGLNDEGPFTFASSPPYIKFKWSSTNHKSASVESVHSQAGVTTDSDKDFRAVIHSSNPGQTTIKLKVEVTDNSRMNQYVKLEDEAQIQVYEKLVIVEPKTEKLLMPLNVYTKIKTNRDHVSKITYELVPSSCSKQHFNGESSSDVISVSTTGLVTSHGSTGTANVLVTVHEDFGFNQTALIEVEVKPVASITLKSLSAFVVNNNGDGPAFPIGSTILFGVTLHDNMGRQFDISSIPLQHRANRDDIIDILPNTENGTIALRTTSIGQSILKVWDKENPAVFDYIRVKVDEGITPSKNDLNVLLGTMVSLKSKVKNVKGVWSASGTSVVIDHKEGTLIGVSVGSSIISFATPQFITYTEVVVSSPSPHNPGVHTEGQYLFLTNAIQEKIFPITMQAVDGYAEPETTSPKSSVNKDLALQSPFECLFSLADADNTFSLAEVFALNVIYVNNKPACVFTTNHLNNDQKKRLSMRDDRIINLSVVLTDRTTRVSWTSQKTKLRFIPDVFVGTDRLVLSKTQPSHTVEVYGSSSQLTSLKVSGSSNIEVTPIVTDDTSRSLYQITASTIPTNDINATVQLTSPLTKTSHEITVNIQGSAYDSQAKCSIPLPTAQSHPSDGGFTFRGIIYRLMGDSGLLIFFYTIVIATVILLLILYHFYVKSKQQPPVVIHSPYVQTPYGHSHSPPPYQATPLYQHSPNAHTPTPYRPNKDTPTRLFSVSQ